MSIKVDIISGFLGAGKTTLIKKLFETGFHNEKVVLIENEFGEIGIDGSFLKESGVNIKEINSGCICCSLVGDFSASMSEVISTYQPERIIIEPSGVGKLSDIVKAVEKLDLNLELNIVATVVDGGKCKVYMKNFGEFFNNQVSDAHIVVMSKVERLSNEKVVEAYELIKEKNPNCNVILADLNEVDPQKLLEALERTISYQSEVEEEFTRGCCCHHHEGEEHDHECCHHHEGEEHNHECCHHHEGEEHDHECCHHHEGEEHDHECCHHHEGEEHDHECCHHHEGEEHNHECCHHHEGEEHDHECCHHHEGEEHDHECCHHHEGEEHDHECCHHHEGEEHNHECCHHHEGEEHDHECCHHHEGEEHDHECCHHHEGEEHDHECCYHHEGGHHHHDADEVFTSVGYETPMAYSKKELNEILDALQEEEKYGVVLRAKGILKSSDQEKWHYFDYVAGDYSIREGEADFVGRIVVIGSQLKKENIETLVLKK
ncbi:MAG: GTP-binding protein [Prevotella sp.]|nr:GTP-binding protein [Prevotella sp.]